MTKLVLVINHRPISNECNSGNGDSYFKLLREYNICVFMCDMVCVELVSTSIFQHWISMESTEIKDCTVAMQCSSVCTDI